MISNRVNYHLRATGEEILFAVLSGKSGMDIRDIDGLIFILQIGMTAYNVSVVANFLKSDNCCSSKIHTIEEKSELYVSCPGRFRDKALACCNFLTFSVFCFLAGLLIHQCSVHGICLSRL